MNEQWVRKYKEEVTGRLDLSAHLSDESLLEQIEVTLFADPGHSRFTASEKQRIVRRIYYSFRGMDAIEPLMDDPRVSEIMINGASEVFIERGGVMENSDVVFESQEKLEDLIQTIVGRVNRAVNESTRLSMPGWQDGSRVNVVLPPIALNGPTIRSQFPQQPYTLDELVALGAMPRESAQLLKGLVEAKYNIFIGGGTGSGKTTLLNALGAMHSEARTGHHD